MLQKYIDDREQDDRNETNKLFESIFLGNNRKRRRGDVEYDELDEAQKKKLRRLEGRLNSDDEVVELGRQVKFQPNSDEEMSESEIKNQQE